MDTADFQEVQVQHSAKPDYVVKETLTVEDLFEKAVERHDRFEKEVWCKDDPDRPSYHKRPHMTAFDKAATVYITAVMANKEEDPLHIEEGRQEWNQKHNATGEREMTLEDVLSVAKVAAGGHDNGNIGEFVDGEFTFLPKYTAAGAEARSKVMVAHDIKESGIGGDKNDLYLQMAMDFIDATEYMKTDASYMEEPFVRAIKVFDQSSPFNDDQTRRKGLIEEMKTEGIITSANPWVFTNFERVQMETYLPYLNDQKSLQKIWRKDLPEKRDDLPNQAISFSDPSFPLGKF
jgi:hypothetical protein